MRVIVTRPAAQAEAQVAALRHGGIDAVALPLIEIRPLHDAAPLQQAWRELPSLALAMFVSANAVQQFMLQRPPGVQWPPPVLAGSTGPGTTAALLAAGVPPPLVVEPQGQDFDTEALWLRLRARDWTGCRVLVVRGEHGRDWLADKLGQAGAKVEFVAAYQRRRPAFDAAQRALLDAAMAHPAQHLWLFSSSEALGHLQALAPAADWSTSRALASHERIAARARQLGFGQVAPAAVGLPALLRQLQSRDSPVLRHGTAR